MNASRIEASVRRAVERAGLGRITPHQLRHTSLAPPSAV
ncbi:hypothetical protein ACFZAR_27475 [Streptomyces sp. NPDC008222]